MMRLALFGIGIFLGVAVSWAVRWIWRDASVMVWLESEQLDE